VVDREVERRKGKLPFFASDVKVLLLRGDSDKLDWTVATNFEFRAMELISEVQ